MSDYQETDPYAGWARTLLDRYFGYHMAGQRARLMVTRELLDDSFPHLGGSAGFVEAVKRGPAFLNAPVFGAETFHHHALLLNRLWRRPPSKRPTSCFALPDNAPLYLPHLAMLCLGWSIEVEDLAGNAFYDRLSKILPFHGLDSGHLGQWRQLWDGLELWTGRLGGQRGVFVVELLGQMVNVGIPRSQVLLTPARIAHLPELFVSTGLAATWRETDYTRLRSVLLHNDSKARAALGGMLFEQIDMGSEIGQATIERLLEFLENPDYRRWAGDPRPDSPEPGGLPSVVKPVPSLLVRLVLEFKGNPAGWCCRFGISGEDPPTAPSNTAGWSFTKVDQAFGGLWLASNQHTGSALIDAATWGKPLHEAFQFVIDAIPGHDQGDVLLRYPAGAIRVFPQELRAGRRLVEEYALPSNGGCYLLVNPVAEQDILLWTERFKAVGGTVADFTHPGLPYGVLLYHLAHLERANEALRKAFPEKSLGHAYQQSQIQLIGGSQVQSAGVQRVYLPYDPPDVTFVAPASAFLVIEGAELVEYGHPDDGVSSGLPGFQARHYELVIRADADIVRLTSNSSDTSWIPESKSFGIGRELSIIDNNDEEENVRFDRLGKRTTGAGIFGVTIDAAAIGGEITNPSWFFEEMDLELGEHASIDDTNHPGWCLLESLVQSRRVTAQEFRRRAERILGWWGRHAWSEARWIRALCHIEVERDNRGRLAYIYPVQAHAYLLPWKTNGRWVAVIGGCPTCKSLKSLIEISATLEVNIHVTDRNSPMLPPRMTCCSDDLEAIEFALNEAGMSLQLDRSAEGYPIPRCVHIAQWAASLREWEEGLNWIDGLAPRWESEFCPHRFTMQADDEFHCPCRLVSVLDSLSPKNQWNVLSHRRLTTECTIEPRHAFLLDPSWGKWKSMSLISEGITGLICPKDDISIPIPYNKKTSTIHVPASLVFPTLLSRALLTVTGLPPRIITKSDCYSRDDSCYLPVDAPPYQGACHCYEYIPLSLTEIVCEKVCAWPVDLVEALQHPRMIY